MTIRPQRGPSSNANVSCRRGVMIWPEAERQLTEQRQTEARQAEERRQTEARQTAERHAAERRRQEQWQAEQQRQRETQQRASAGNGGNGGGGGHNTPPGSGGGGPPGGGPLRNFDPDIRNLADPRARVESYRTDPLNAQGREEFKNGIQIRSSFLIIGRTIIYTGLQRINRIQAYLL